MNDGILMSMPHGFAALQEQSQPLTQITTARPAPVRQLPPIHILHGQPRHTAGLHSRINQTGNVRMTQPSQHLLLLLETPE